MDLQCLSLYLYFALATLELRLSQNLYITGESHAQNVESRSVKYIVIKHVAVPIRVDSA